VAIRPPSDLVLDVATAADPARLKAAQEQLGKTNPGGAGAAFQAALANAGGAATAAAPAQSAKTAVAQTLRNAPMIRKDTSEAKAREKFEAYFLQSAVQEMLPKDAESVFGAGLAGDIWKSMLAEQLAAEMAKSAKFGIAERLAGNHFSTIPGRGAATPSAVSAPSGHPDAASKNLPFLQDRRIPDLPIPGVTPGATSIKRS
jgi:peptidoglycan hydrolase FlgJ